MRSTADDRMRVSPQYRPRPRESGWMSPNGSVSRYRLPCLSTCTEPRSVARTMGVGRGGRKRTSAMSAVAIGSSEGRQALGLVGHDQGVDEIVDLAGHDARAVVHGLADAVVRDAVLREVVGPHLLAAVAPADHGLARRRIGRTLLLDLQVEQSRAQHGQRLGLVLVLALLVLDLDHQAG